VYVTTIFALQLSLVGIVIIHAVMALVPIPQRYPDIFACLVAVYSCAHLCIAWVYFNAWQWLADHEQTGKQLKNGSGRGSSHRKAE
jgi:hypothetical protein